jgi:hypothetical protein
LVPLSRRGGSGVQNFYLFIPAMPFDASPAYTASCWCLGMYGKSCSVLVFS